MQVLTSLKIIVVACFAIRLHSTWAGRPMAELESSTNSQPAEAQWWKNYRAVYLESPGFEDILTPRHMFSNVLEYVEPFEQRIEQLNRLKAWVLSNAETQSALSVQQRATLQRQFYKWDRSTVEEELALFRGMRQYMLTQDSDLVKEVETVLKDIAIRLPNVSP